jgi:predicted Zn-dependent protease
MKRFIEYIYFFSILLVFCGCAVNPVTGDRDFVLMSEAEEISMGRQYHPKILQQYGKYDDPALQAYVSQVGKKLASFSHRPELVYRFTVLDSTDINAFALPGGYIYITRGLLAYLNTEAELAGILGHEIGHVTARHAVRQHTAATAGNIGITIGQIFLPELRNQVASNLYGLLSGVLLSGYGREHELEADGLGAEYLARAGYDPYAMIDVLKILKSQAEFSSEIAKSEGLKVQTYHGLFASHPDNDTRLQNIINNKRLLFSRKNHLKDDNNFLAMLSGLVFGDSAAEGIRRKNKFYHGELGFAIYFPEGWILKNRPDSLQGVAPKGKARAFLTLQDINKVITPREFLTERLGFKQLANGKKIEPAGLNGYTALTEVKSSVGMRYARVSVIYFNDRAYILIGIAKDRQLQKNINDSMLKTALSFHPLSKQEAILAKPLTIQLQRATASTTYRKLALESRLPGYAESQLRLLNHQYPKGEPRPGQILKIVR